MSNPNVTIIVVPRERFQFARESLESLYANTTTPFQLIYVDNNSPAVLRQYLNQESQRRGFQLLHSEHYLSPNAARNLALKEVKTPYVAFVDNDVVFSSGWLQTLLDCQKDTGATVVGSLVCQYRPVHTIVHCAGGTYMDPEDYAAFARGELNPSGSLGPSGNWQIKERTPYQNQPLEKVRGLLSRQPTGFVEFHAMLVARSIFDRIGYLDEKFACTKEYLDFCMTVARAGGVIYLEPDSVVTFLTHPPAPALNWEDLPYFMLRWSDYWELRNLQHFRQKWNLADSSYFQKRYQKLGQRRRKALIKPIAEHFSFLGKPTRKWIEQQLSGVEKQINRLFSSYYEHFMAKEQTTENKQAEKSHSGYDPAIAPNSGQ